MTDWTRARCLGKTDLFFSEKEKEIKLAKDICFSCPLRRDCLVRALEGGEAWGIWGGHDYQELRLIAPAMGYEPPNRKTVEHGTERGAAWHRRRKESMCNDCLLAYNNGTAERMRLYRMRKKDSR